MATYDNQTCLSDCLLLEFCRSNKKASMKSLTVRYVHKVAFDLRLPMTAVCRELSNDPII